MHFAQYYLDCLSQASYLIGDETTGRAVVVDPRRDIDEYVRDAEAAGLTIELVLETHFHADFLSGHLELAAATGAEIGFSDVAETEFASRKLADGERISLGQVTLEILHTPGHTPESISIVVYEHPDDEIAHSVLTGDTLFIGDVGRPDLLRAIGFTKEELASQLYDSLHDKLLSLPDATRVFPAHGAGSACGKNLSTETSSTMGEQRATNYACCRPDKETFIGMVTEGQPPAPDYFLFDAVLNRKDHGAAGRDGAAVIDRRWPRPRPRWPTAPCSSTAATRRSSPEATWWARSTSVSTGATPSSPARSFPRTVDIVLVVESGFELEAKNRLGRIGFDRVVGCVAHPLQVMADHPQRVQRGIPSDRRSSSRSARARSADLQLVDVRNPGELIAGTIAGAVHMPVGELPSRVGDLDATRPTVVFCAGGYRSSVAASVLRLDGFGDVSDVVGGHTAWLELTQHSIV